MADVNSVPESSEPCSVIKKAFATSPSPSTSTSIAISSTGAKVALKSPLEPNSSMFFTTEQEEAIYKRASMMGSLPFEEIEPVLLESPKKVIETAVTVGTQQPGKVKKKSTKNRKVVSETLQSMRGYLIEVGFLVINEDGSENYIIPEEYKNPSSGGNNNLLQKYEEWKAKNSKEGSRKTVNSISDAGSSTNKDVVKTIGNTNGGEESNRVLEEVVKKPDDVSKSKISMRCKKVVPNLVLSPKVVEQATLLRSAAKEPVKLGESATVAKEAAAPSSSFVDAGKMVEDSNQKKKVDKESDDVKDVEKLNDSKLKSSSRESIPCKLPAKKEPKGLVKESSGRRFVNKTRKPVTGKLKGKKLTKNGKDCEISAATKEIIKKRASKVAKMLVDANQYVLDVLKTPDSVILTGTKAKVRDALKASMAKRKLEEEQTKLRGVRGLPPAMRWPPVLKTYSKKLTDLVKTGESDVPLTRAEMRSLQPPKPPMTDPRPKIEIHNIVTNITFNAPLDLVKLYTMIVTTEYNPRRFPALVLKIFKPKTTALLFSSGKMVICGGKSVPFIQEAVSLILSLVKRADHPNVEYCDVKINNVMGTSDLKFPIRLDKMYENYFTLCRYEPEIFPALIYKLPQPRVTLLVFVNGKVVITGGKSSKMLQQALEIMYPILRSYGMHNS